MPQETAYYEVSMPRFLVTSLTSGAGVSNVTLGMLVALRKLGYSASAHKTDVSLVASIHHRRITGRFAHSLSPEMLNPQEILYSFVRGTSGSEIALVEGTSLSYDEDAAIAKNLGLPIVIVIDARTLKQQASIESMRQVLGDTSGAGPAGVILNFVPDSETGESIKKYFIENFPNVSYLGGVLESRQFAGKASVELNRNFSLLTRNQIVRLGSLIERSIDLKKLHKIASSCQALRAPMHVVEGDSRRFRVAVADDQAFHLTTQDNLDLIRRLGGELVSFSPLIDSRLPSRVELLYLPGAQLEPYLLELSNNEAIKDSIKKFISEGGQLYAEGSATAYLCNSVRSIANVEHKMLGIIDGKASVSAEPDVLVEDPYHYFSFAIEEDTSFFAKGARGRGFYAEGWNYEIASKPISSRIVGDELDQLNWMCQAFGLNNKCFVTPAHIHWGSLQREAIRFIPRSNDAE
jgi:cobyrinic acid a,c-diamide synthase